MTLRLALRDFRWMFSLVCILWLTGCSGKPTVYVYAKYLSDMQTQQLQQALAKNALNVKVNQLYIPTDVDGNTLLYSLLLQQPDTIDKVATIAAAQGFEITHEQALTQGNHWYTKDSVALILFPNKRNGVMFKADLVGNYEVFGCDTSMQLALDSQGRFALTGDAADNLEPAMTRGSWHYRQHPVIELRPHVGVSAYSYFEVSREQTQDQISALTFTYLAPLQARFLSDGCTLRTAIRH